VLIDGDYIEPQTGQDKITFECGCLEKESQDIVWGFVVSEHRETLPTPMPTPAESLPPVQRIVGPRVKVAMQRQSVPVSPEIYVPRIRVEALLSDSLPVGSTSEQQKKQQELTFLRPLELSDGNENNPRSSNSAFGQGSPSFERARLTPPNDDFHDISAKLDPRLNDQNNAFEVPPLDCEIRHSDYVESWDVNSGQSNPLSFCTTCTN
jgi:hypothetical protein